MVKKSHKKYRTMRIILICLLILSNLAYCQDYVINPTPTYQNGYLTGLRFKYWNKENAIVRTLSLSLVITRQAGDKEIFIAMEQSTIPYLNLMPNDTGFYQIQFNKSYLDSNFSCNVRFFYFFKPVRCIVFKPFE